MNLVIDKNNILWQISEVNEITVYHGKAPNDAKVILGDFDGFNTTWETFLKAFGVKNMRITEQSTVYELTITELTALMSKELGVSESKIQIRFKQNDNKETYAVEVVVNGPVPQKGTGTISI